MADQAHTDDQGAHGAEHGADAAHHGEKHGPTDQFIVEPIVPIEVGGIDLAFTNASLFMMVTVGLIWALMVRSTQGRSLIPNRWQCLAEMSYELVASMVRDNVGSGGRQYFPFVFSIFMFVLIGNLVGMVPGTFTFTSHIIVTFSLALVIFIGVTVIGFMKHGLGYLGILFPTGAPAWTAVILIPIELVSYLSRPISLSVRLFANMTVGHLVLKVIAGFVIPLGLFGVVPILALTALTAFEIMIAFIQAYVFAILTCIYLNDALHMH